MLKTLLDAFVNMSAEYKRNNSENVEQDFIDDCLDYVLGEYNLAIPVPSLISVRTIKNDGNIEERMRIVSNELDEKDKEYIKKLFFYTSIINANKSFMDSVYTTTPMAPIYFSLSKKSAKEVKKLFDNSIKKYIKEQKKEDLPLLEKFEKDNDGYQTNQEYLERMKNELPTVLDDLYSYFVSHNETVASKESLERIYIFYELEDEAETLKMYRNEYKKYLYLKSFNKNKDNSVYEEEIFGRPIYLNNDNEKKKNIKNWTRDKKQKFTYLSTSQEAVVYAIMQAYIKNHLKFEMILDLDKNILRFPEKTLFSKGSDSDEISDNSIIFRYEILNKSKQLTNVIYYIGANNIARYNLKVERIINPYLNSKKNMDENYLDDIYSTEKRTLKDIESLVHSVYFNKALKPNYFIKSVKDSSMAVLKNNTTLINRVSRYRNGLFNFFYNGDTTYFKDFVKYEIPKIIDEEIASGSSTSIVNMLNVYEALLDEFGEEKKVNMKDIIETFDEKIKSKEEFKIESDEEYQYVAGQLLRYLSNRSESQNSQEKRMSITSTRHLRLNKLADHVLKYYNKYSYSLYSGGRFSRAYVAFQRYQPQGDGLIERYVSMGYEDINRLYEEKADKENLEVERGEE